MENRRFAWDDTDPEKRARFGFYSNGHITIGMTEGVNDESALLVEGFQPTAYELGVLARHYLNRCYEVEFGWRCYEQVDGSACRFRAFAATRLGTIADILGAERFEAAVADVHEHWQHAFDRADEYERQLAPCTQCGAGRTIVDDIGVPAAERDGTGVTNPLCFQCATAAGEQEE